MNTMTHNTETEQFRGFRIKKSSSSFINRLNSAVNLILLTTICSILSHQMLRGSKNLSLYMWALVYMPTLALIVYLVCQYLLAEQVV